MNVAEPKPASKGRILYVITKANWGGAQRYVYDLATAAERDGHFVTVAFGTEGELSERLVEVHIPVMYVRGLGRDIDILNDVRALFELLHLIRTLHPDIVHANSSKAGLLACVAARISKHSRTSAPRIIFTSHGWSFNESRPAWQRWVFALFHLVTAWCADTIVCVSEAVRRDGAWMPFVKNKWTVIKHGIAPIVLVEKGAARAKLAPRLPVDSPLRAPAAFWIGTLAELHPTKGLDIAIHAFARIAHQLPNTVLVLIGEGQDRNRLVSLARQYQLTNRVHFCSYVHHAPSLLSALDIFLFPSRSEALGFALLEAGNARLPVVASNVGGIPEIVEDGVSGLLIEREDAAGFAGALSKLVASPDLRAQLGNALHERVATAFSKERAISETLALYASP